MIENVKTLVFAEKPSVGRDIARVLGANHRGDGFFENPDWIVTWGIGHLISLAEPGEQDPAWKKWSLQSLPMIPSGWKLSVLPNTAPQFRIVKSLLDRGDVGSIVNAADAGREGELIFRLVYRMAGCKKPFKRLWISSMTDEAIGKGFSSLRPGPEFDSLAAAAECRMRADWLVGLNFTRCYTKKLGTMLTLGRVQTPTLALVVKRHLEISDFKPTPYWEIETDLGDFKASWFDPAKKEQPSRIDDPEVAKKIADELNKTETTIQSVTKSKKNLPPPFLYDLTTLQREANSRYGLTAAQTLAAAQSLYEQRKAITYPRTDSRYLSGDIHPTLKARLVALPPDYEQFRKPLLQKDLPKSKRIFDDKQVSDHHAIIPTEKKIPDTSAWKPDEQKVFDLIARRFLAVFFPDHEYLSTTVILVGGKNHLKATGKVVTLPGWRVLYDREESESDEGGEQALPPLSKGDRRLVKEAKLLSKKTKPPAAYTESTLLQAMETAGKFVEDEELRQAMKDGGLGTPATRAEIIEKLIRVGYMFREKKKLVPTQKGITLVSLVDGHLKSPELTGNWEKRLVDISKGKGNSPDFMNDISLFVQTTVNLVKNAHFKENLRDENEKNYQSTGMPKPLVSEKTVPNQTGKQQAKMMVNSSPTNIKTPPSQKTGQSPGLANPQNSSRPPVPGQRPSFGTCPACLKGRIIEGNRGFGCDRFREGCSYVVWKEFFGKKLTRTVIETLITGKPTRLLKGFTTPDGRKVSGKIRMREDRKGIEFLEFAAREDK